MSAVLYLLHAYLGLAIACAALLIAAIAWCWMRERLAGRVPCQRAIAPPARRRRPRMEDTDRLDAEAAQFCTPGAEGLGPRILARRPSELVPLAALNPSAQDAINEILGKRGSRR